MLPLLAQLTTANLPSFVTFVVGGSATLFLLNQALRFYKDHIKEQPSPGTTYATKEELRQAHGRMTREKEDVDRQLLALKDEQQRLDEKLDAKIGELQDRIDRVPERTINLLKTTKDLI